MKRSRTARDALAGVVNVQATAGERIRMTRSRSHLCANAVRGQGVQGGGAQTTGPNAGEGRGAPVARARSTGGRGGGDTGRGMRGNSASIRDRGRRVRGPL